MFNGTNTIGNSEISQVGSDVGINEAAPTATLDVNGTENVRGVLYLPPVATASSTIGQRSQLLQLGASAWSTSTNAAVTPTFKLLTNFVNNDTASPSGQLEFHYQNGTASLSVLSISSNGVIKFAPLQTFPGTIASVSAASPLTATTTSGAVALGLNTSALETTLNNQYAQLAGSNVFTGFLQANSNGGPGTEAVAGIGVRGSAGVYGQSDTGNGVLGYSEGPLGGFAGVFGFGSANKSSTYGTETGYQSAGVWGDSMAASGSQFAAGVIGTADNADGGSFFNNSQSYAAMYAQNMATYFKSQGVLLPSGASVGIQGSGFTGVYGISPLRPTMFDGQPVEDGGVGVYGVVGSPSQEGHAALENGQAGVWADTGISFGTALSATADDGSAGLFYNNSIDSQSIYAENDSASSQAIVFEARGGPQSGSGICTISVSGDLSCTGTVSNVVNSADGSSKVQTYSMQSAENWLEDAGTGQMAGGFAHVDLEPIYGATVNTGVEYHVFLTPKGDCMGLYVTNETTRGFDVRELGGGRSSIEFDYRIMAKRAGSENLRLVDVTGQMKKLAEPRVGARRPATRALQSQPADRIEQQTAGPVRPLPQIRTPSQTDNHAGNAVAAKGGEPK